MTDWSMFGLVRYLIKNLDPNPEREGLRETPKRFIEAWQFWCSGAGIDPQSVLKVFEDGAEHYDEMIFQGSIPFWSNCEHHMAPFFGVAHIGYIPNGRIVGLSKIARVTDILARRLQVQERLTVQIADALMQGLTPLGVGVVLQARHTCMESRGVQKIGSITTTSSLIGNFREPAVRAEFMGFVHSADRGIASV